MHCHLHNDLNGAQRLNDLNILNKVSAIAVRDVPDMTRPKIAVGARHRSFLDVAFRPQNWSSKRLNDALLCYLVLSNQELASVRPNTCTVKT